MNSELSLMEQQPRTSSETMDTDVRDTPSIIVDYAGFNDGSLTEAAAALAVEEAADKVKGPWSPEEDSVLSNLVEKFGARNWSLIARGINGRSGKSCRLRWCNQLAPHVKTKPFSGVDVVKEKLLIATDRPSRRSSHYELQIK